MPMDRTVAIKTWEALANAIDEIYNRNASQLSFEELYRNAYNLVLHKHGTLLYEGVSEKLSSHLLDTVDRLADLPDSSMLEDIASTWSEHQVSWRTLVFVPFFFFQYWNAYNFGGNFTDHYDYGQRYSDVHG